jgi:hypothetical protein
MTPSSGLSTETVNRNTLYSKKRNCLSLLYLLGFSVIYEILKKFTSVRDTVQQGPPSVATTAAITSTAWYKTRTVVSGLWLAGLAGLYFVIIYPVAIAEVPYAGYRFTFNVIDAIYAINLAILATEWLYKLARPPMSSIGTEPISRSNALGMVLRFAFMLCIGGSYVTGAAIASPQVFNPLIPSLASLGAVNDVWFGAYLHSIFATLLIVFGAAILIFEVAKIATKKSSFRNWFVKARYPEIKLFWWLLAVAVIVQGVLGLFLLGTVSPLGPWGLIGLNSYSFENLVRLIHGPMGAVTFALFTNQIYFRLRPEFHIR